MEAYLLHPLQEIVMRFLLHACTYVAILKIGTVVLASVRAMTGLIGRVRHYHEDTYLKGS